MKKLLTLVLVAFLTAPAFAQIPNPSFEMWDSSAGYKVPVGWDSPDSVTHLASVYTCEQGTPGFAGADYLKLTSKTVLTSVVPGIAVSGKIDFTALQPKSGFANTSRPASLKGEWQYMASGADQGHVMVLLTKWNSATSRHDTVAFANQTLTGMVMSWTAFTIPLTYYAGSVPDTALILLSSSGTTPVANSYLYVDTLAFSGNVPAGVVTLLNAVEKTSIYPNPATGATTLNYYSATGQAINAVITDINGRVIKVMDFNTSIGDNRLPVAIEGLSKGLYFVKVTDEYYTETQKLLVD